MTENGRHGAPGDLVAKLVEEEKSPEVGDATRLHQSGWEEIAMVHLHRQQNAIENAVHHVRFVL